MSGIIGVTAGLMGANAVCKLVERGVSCYTEKKHLKIRRAELESAHRINLQRASCAQDMENQRHLAAMASLENKKAENEARMAQGRTICSAILKPESSLMKESDRLFNDIIGGELPSGENQNRIDCFLKTCKLIVEGRERVGHHVDAITESSLRALARRQ